MKQQYKISILYFFLLSVSALFASEKNLIIADSESTFSYHRKLYKSLYIGTKIRYYFTLIKDGNHNYGFKNPHIPSLINFMLPVDIKIIPLEFNFGLINNVGVEFDDRTMHYDFGAYIKPRVQVTKKLAFVLSIPLFHAYGLITEPRFMVLTGIRLIPQFYLHF